jgi:diguanylate cyclase (GGDEF)-like protein
MIFLSWMIYLGGIIFFSNQESVWALMALGALPVLVTAWSLGMVFGFGSAALSISIHLISHLINPLAATTVSGMLFQHLIGFTLLAITGMFAGHLRELQHRSQSEFLALTENNQKLIRLSEALEATNRLTTDMITARDWIDKIPDLLKKVATAADIEHLFLLQITENNRVGFTGNKYHYWMDIQTHYPPEESPLLPIELTSWITSARDDFPTTGRLEELAEPIREYFYMRDRGNFAIFPVFANNSLWGFIGFETYQKESTWDKTELNTFRSIAQTLGAIVYKKRIEENLNLRARELDSLQKTSLDISSSDHLESGLQSVLSQIFQLTPAYDANIYLYQDQDLSFYISLGKNSQQTLPFSHPGEEEISLQVAQSTQDYYISDVTAFNDIPGESPGQKEALISFALKAAAEVIGVLNIWYPDIRTFSPDEKTILRLLADQAASAIISMQFLQAEREQRILADSLRKANLMVTDNLELKSVLESILVQVLNLVSARDAQIFLYDGKNLDFGAVIYKEGIQPDPVFPLDEKSIFYQTARRGERILISDIQNEENLPGSWKTGALASLPLIFHRKVIGIMNVSFIKPGELDESLLQVLDLLSNQAAIAINNARTFEAEKKQRKLAQALQHTGRAIQSSLDLEIVLDQILDQIATAIDYDSANLILIEEGVARSVRQHGFQDLHSDGRELTIDSYGDPRFNTFQKMIQSKQPLIIPDTSQNQDWIITETTQEVMSWAGAPILAGDQVIGFLSLNNNQKDFYNKEHEELLTAFASQASIALEHARLHQEIQDLAITDPLTKINNRRGLERWGQYEIDRAKRFNSSLSAIFFDLDKFKNINDNYGHDAGDEVLREVVACCQRVIRKIDIFSRVGGEEFLIILPETPLPIAFHVAERIRKTVAGQTFDITGYQLNITISLGVVELNEEMDTLADLVNAADQYMYRAKQAGRNQTSYPTS